MTHTLLLFGSELIVLGEVYTSMCRVVNHLKAIHGYRYQATQRLASTMLLLHILPSPASSISLCAYYTFLPMTTGFFNNLVLLSSSVSFSLIKLFGYHMVQFPFPVCCAPLPFFSNSRKRKNDCLFLKY